MLTQHYRFMINGRKIPVITACAVTSRNNVLVGFSVCDLEDINKCSKVIGRAKALERALYGDASINKQYLYELPNTPDVYYVDRTPQGTPTVSEIISHFLQRCNHYFKNKTVIYPKNLTVRF